MRNIEFTLGDEIIKINYPCYIFVPKYTKHCPLDIKRVGKPFIFIDVSITPEASVRPEKLSKVVGRPKYIAKNNKPKKGSKKSEAAEVPKAAKAVKAPKAAKAAKAEKVKKTANAPKKAKAARAPKTTKAVKAPKVAKTAKKSKTTRKK
jgi:hypothetical protein